MPPTPAHERTSLTLPELYLTVLLAICLWREARSESLDGIRAVAWVIRNRHLAWKKDWDDVIATRNQFSSMGTRGDPQLTLWPDDDAAQFQTILQTALEVYLGEGEDPTHGALYYWNPRTATSKWFRDKIAGNPREHPRTAELGQHIFFA
jgi:spore germination cell wall hydrolase CwlJ-like protein